jgi:hypothetical protein
MTGTVTGLAEMRAEGLMDPDEIDATPTVDVRLDMPPPNVVSFRDHEIAASAAPEVPS